MSNRDDTEEGVVLSVLNPSSSTNDRQNVINPIIVASGSPVANRLLPGEGVPVVNNQPSDVEESHSFAASSLPGMELGALTWSTGTFDCLKDEETCWWSCWCPILLSARTAEGFGVGSADHIVKVLIYFVLAMIVCLLLVPGSLLLVLFAMSLYFAWMFSGNRAMIASRLHFVSSERWSDFFFHLCCYPCVISQEGREAKLRGVPFSDFCSSQPLSELAMPTNSDLESDIQETNNLEPSEMTTKISTTTRTLLKFSGGFIALICFALAFGSPGALGLFLLTFVEPLVFMYFIYWRHRRRYSQLDYVLKMFILGFFLAPIQSIVFEYILQAIIGIIAVITFAILNPSFHTTTAIGGAASQFSIDAGYILQTISSFSSHSFWTRSVPDLVINNIPGRLRDVAYSAAQHPLFPSVTTTMSWTHFLRADAEGTDEDVNEETDDIISSIPRDVLRKNIWLVVIVVFLMAFVVAAGVEELMKHFCVRCCRFPVKLRDPRTVTVYLCAAALGFTTAENIEYVLATYFADSDGVNFTGGLVVLVARVCTPIHLFCAMLQSVSLSKNVMHMTESSLFALLFPAILLHGSFDFVLFLGGALHFIYDDGVFDLAALISAICIAVGGGMYSVYSVKQIEVVNNLSWRLIGVEEDHAAV